MADIERISSREIYRNQWLALREDQIAYADGSPGLYTVIEKRDFALVVPYSASGFWLVEQYRYAIGRRAWEFPQGSWPVGHSGTPAELAAAELSEETGLRADDFVHLGRLASAPGYATNCFDVFVATGLHEGQPSRERSEADMVHAHVVEDELDRWIDTGRFTDSNSLAALSLFHRWRSR